MINRICSEIIYPNVNNAKKSLFPVVQGMHFMHFDAFLFTP